MPLFELLAYVLAAWTAVALVVGIVVGHAISTGDT